MTQAPQSAEATPRDPDGRSTTFQAVQGEREHYSGETLLVSAYAVVWLVILAWVVAMWRKQGTLDSRLYDLERELDKASARRDQKKQA